MKIICMDCQTESYVDAEMVKGKKLMECAHCAKDFRANSDNQMTTAIAPYSDDATGFNPIPLPDQSSEDEAQWLNDEDLLDISVIPFSSANPELSTIDEVITLTVDEPKTASFDEETPQLDYSQQLQLNHSTENTDQPLQKLDSEVEAVAGEPRTLTHLPAADGVSVSGESKKVSLAAFSTPKLITIAATFILFISLAGVINSPVGKNSLTVEKPTEAGANPVEEKVVQNTASPVQVEATEKIKPTPSPSPAVLAEQISVPATEPVNQPVVNEPAETGDGGFTVQVGSHNQVGLANEQAEKIRTAGYAPRVVSVEIPKRGRWHRVQVGSFSDRQEAQRLGAQLVGKGVVESFVIAEK